MTTYSQIVLQATVLLLAITNDLLCDDTLSPKRIAYDGYCAVTLVEDRFWARGDPHLVESYQGLQFYFADVRHQKSFIAHPERFAPYANGYDIVAAVDYCQWEVGEREHGVFCEDSVIMFANNKNESRFMDNHDWYLMRFVKIRHFKIPSTGQPESKRN